MLARRIAAVMAIAATPFAVSSVTRADQTGPADAAIGYWTAERVASAVPRDLLIDERGLGYQRTADGGLTPYGHTIAAKSSLAMSRPTGQTNRAADLPSAAAAPVVEDLSPANVTVGASATFRARISSDVGLRSVTASVGRVGGGLQSFAMSYVGADAGAEVWEVDLSGLTDGNWNWQVEARDSSRRGGIRVTTSLVPFTVDTGSGGGGGGGGGGDTLVTGARWTGGGPVQTAAGRILFAMDGGNYVCSGTTVTDGVTGRSIVLTAAHCIYDDVNKAFASNAIFIPSQDDGGTDRTDSNCSNDPIGCWSLDHGVVDINWTTRTFPDNIPWDYGFYVVGDSGAHSGNGSSSVLDDAAGSLPVSFTAPSTGQFTTALGYSYADDPNFMHCQETMTTNGASNYWLDSCTLSGGSSGGPWMQPFSNGDGVVMSVNSWGYTTRDGMAGPKLHGTSASLLFASAKSTDLASAARGFVIDPSNPPATTTTLAPTTTVPATTTTTTVPPSTTTTIPVTTTTVPGPALTLSVVSSKIKGQQVGDLSWTGATSTNVDIIRDGARVATVANSGAYQDRTGQKGGGTTVWQVCEGGTTTCSAEVVVVW